MVKVLFVCGGNTCRSPMASASATKTFGDRVSISTAGVAAYGQQATKDAVTLVQQRYGIDISMHVSRDVATLADLTCYDYIIAMHPDIATRLTAQWHVDHTKLIVWNIDDPYLQGRAAYEACLDTIEESMLTLQDIINNQL